VLTILSALFGGWPLPYVAAQVLWINLVTKGLQDVSLAFEPGEPGLLQEPPAIREEGVINRPVLQRMIWLGLFMAVGTMGVFWWIMRQDVSLELARSVAMTQMVMFQFFHVFNCRSMHRSLLSINPFGNPYVLGSVTLALLAHLAILHVDWLQAVFDTEPIPLWVWGIIVAVSLTILLVAEIDKIFVRRRRARSMEPKGRVLEEAGEWEDQ
jgi:magnesium-transporting ATPase (P-type)